MPEAAAPTGGIGGRMRAARRLTGSRLATSGALAPALIVALALAVRVLVVVGTPNFAPPNDAADFDRIAYSLAATGHFPPARLTALVGPTAFRPPLLPMLLSLVYRISGLTAHTRWEAGRLFEAGLGALAVGLIYLIGSRVWDRRVGLVAGGLAAVYPPLVLVGSSLLSESLFIPLSLGATLCALLYRDSGRARFGVGAGVLLAAGALTRSNGIILVIPLAFLVWQPPRRSWRAMRAPAVVVAVMLLALVPWTARNANAFHEFVPTTTEAGYALTGTYNSFSQSRTDFPALWGPPVSALLQLEHKHPDYDEAQLSNALIPIGVDYIKAHPVSVPRTVFWTGARLLDLTGTRLESEGAGIEGYSVALADISVYAFWLIALLAIAGWFTAARRRATAAFWWCPAALLLSTLPFEGDTRYRSPADPWFVTLAALALIAAWRRWHRRSHDAAIQRDDATTGEAGAARGRSNVAG